MSKDKQYSGAVLVAKKGKIITNKSVGYENYEVDAKNTAVTKFRIGNMTNQFTAAAILQLEDKGVLNVEDTLSKYIPNYPKGDSITIYELLSHTSGIPNYSSFDDNAIASRQSYTIQKIIDSFKNKPLEFTPGSKYKYSDSNYILLGYIIEKISGKKYSDYINDSILRPLKMNNTGIMDNETIIKNKASGYEFNELGKIINVKYQDASRWYSATGMYSTIGDLYLWDKALYGDTIISKKGKNKFFNPESGKDYSCGWISDSTAGHKFIWQDNAVSGFSGSISRYIKDESVIIVLSNTTMSNEDIAKITSNIAVYLFQ